MNIHLCSDESGDTGYTDKSSKYFIITTIRHENIDKLRRLAREIQRSKRHNKNSSGLHAYSERRSVKNKLIRKLKDFQIECWVCMLDKHEKQITDPYFHLLEKLAKHISKVKINRITVAKRDTRKSYTTKIVKMFKNLDIELDFRNTTSEKALQIADFYSWIIFSHLEYSRSEYFLKLKDQIHFI